MTSGERSSSRPTPSGRGIREDFGELVDERTAADLLGTKVRTLQSWRRKGQGPPFVKMGSARNALVRYPLVQLREFLDRHLVPTPGFADPHSGSASADAVPAGSCATRNESSTLPRRPTP